MAMFSEVVVSFASTFQTFRTVAGSENADWRSQDKRQDQIGSDGKKVK
jgi:hypothetical protein